LTRKIKFLIVALFITGLLFIFSSNEAKADDTVTVQVSPLDQTVIDTSTVTSQSIQIKIDSATATLNSQSQIQAESIIHTIQANVSNTDTQTAISIATTQEPIKTAVESATVQIQEAHNALTNVQAALNVAQIAQENVDTQTATVFVVQAIVDSATVTVNDAQTVLTAEAAKLPDLQSTETTTQSEFYTENSNLGTATSNVQTAQTDLSNAQTDLANNGTITVTTNGVTASVYSAGGRSPALPASNATPILTTTVPQITYNWGSGPVLGTRSDGVIVKFTGTITIPDEANTLRYAVYSDDGALLYIDGQVAINNWRDQGSAWSQYSQTYNVATDKQQDFTLWYYENGGGAVCTLGWMIIRADGTGYFTSPTAINFGTTTTAQDPIKVAAVDTAQTNLTSAQSAYSTQLAVRDAAYQAWQDAIHAVDAQQSVIDSAQAAYDTAQQNLTIAQQNLTIEQQNLTTANQNLTIALQTADSLANNATTQVNEAVTAMTNAAQVTTNYYAEQQRIAAEKAAALAAKQAAEAAAAALAAQQAAEQAAAAQAKAEADAKAAAEEAAKAEADRIAAEEAKAKAEADALAAKQAADAKAAQDAADAKAKADQDAANAKAEADKAAAEQAAKDKAAADAKAASDKAAQDAANKAAEQTKADQAAKDAQAKADAAKAEADKAKQDAIGVKPNSPDQLSDTVVKQAPAEVLVPHIQQDVKGVENGGIEFFGTKSAPQVVGEDGKLTPAAPPPGSGLPIPAEAITTTDTFIGQPGGTTFNAPDIAVPVIETPLPATIAAVPGAVAVNKAYVALANIGNDMSPVTRKKAKKILVLTVAVAAIRRRFGQ
jgi:hypothetical protein